MELSIRELRIGNLLLDIDSNDLIEIREYYQLDSCNSLYKPIPLTEEWLLKFGKINWIIKDIDGIFFWFNGEKKYLKFVHSLQNLYFALRGTELTLKNN